MMLPQEQTSLSKFGSKNAVPGITTWGWFNKQAILQTSILKGLVYNLVFKKWNWHTDNWCDALRYEDFINKLTYMSMPACVFLCSFFLFCKLAIFCTVGLDEISDSLSTTCCSAVECKCEVKGAIPDIIIKMKFKCGEVGNEPIPRSIKPEPRKPLLLLALDMFMFQLCYVKQPPTPQWICAGASVWVCTHAGESLVFLSGWFQIHIFLLADLTEEQLNWG